MPFKQVADDGDQYGGHHSPLFELACIFQGCVRRRSPISKNHGSPLRWIVSFVPRRCRFFIAFVAGSRRVFETRSEARQGIPPCLPQVRWSRMRHLWSLSVHGAFLLTDILDSKANLHLDEVKGMINSAEKSVLVHGIGLHLYLVLWNFRPAAASARHERAF